MTEATSPRGWLWLVGIPLTALGLLLYHLYAESAQHFLRDFLYWLDYTLPNLLGLFD